MSEISKINQNFSIKKVDSETIYVQIFRNDIIASIVGEFNNNLNELERLTKTKI